MANAKNITDLDGNILIIGNGGSHKTDFLTRIPGVYVFDFDKGMAVARGRDVEYDTYKDAAKDITITGTGTLKAPVMKEQGIFPFGTGWEEFYKKFIEIGNRIIDKKPNAPKAIGFDSLTMMSMLAVNKILRETGHDMPHQGTWGAHHEYFKTIFSMATAWPIRFICTAHIERAENPLTQVTEKLPLLVGKLAGLVPVFFDEVWYAETVGGKPIIHTVQTPQLQQAKSRLWNLPDGTELSWEALGKYISQPKAAV